MIEHKDLSLFLIDGKADGRLFVEVDDYPLVFYRFPKDSFNKDTQDLKYVDNSSIYLLFGKKNGRNTIYVGQATKRKDGKGPLRRILEPHGDEEWRYAFIFTTTDNSFTSSALKYLENTLYNKAIHANNYEVTNRSEPTNDLSIKDKDRRSYNKYINHILELVELFGHKSFVLKPQKLQPKQLPPQITQKPKTAEPTPSLQTPNEVEQVKTRSPQTPAEPTPKQVKVAKKKRVRPELPNIDESQGKIFFCIRRNALAYGRLLENKRFVVMKGSVISPKEVTPYAGVTFENRYAKNRDKIDGCNIIADIEFDTVSGASRFVTKTSSNGNDDWRTRTGEKLGDYCARNGIGVTETPEMDAPVIPNTPFANTLFLCKRRGADASGYFNPETNRFTVRKGSKTTEKPMSPSQQEYLDKHPGAKLLWTKYGDYLANDGITFKCDGVFSSPSYAAAFILRRNANGKDSWHDENGKSLADRLNELE